MVVPRKKGTVSNAPCLKCKSHLNRVSSGFLINNFLFTLNNSHSF